MAKVDVDMVPNEADNADIDADVKGNGESDVVSVVDGDQDIDGTG